MGHNPIECPLAEYNLLAPSSWKKIMAGITAATSSTALIETTRHYLGRVKIESTGFYSQSDF